MTKSAPVSALNWFTAWLSGSSWVCSSVVPRLMLTTLACSVSAAHSMPAMIPDVAPDPVLSSTLPISRSASGATPRSLPSEAAPVPATVEAVWVPWPKWSTVSSPGMKLLAATTRFTRSGWVASTPVSRTATRTPVPVPPAAHTAGAPIWAVLSARVAVALLSSHTLSTPSVKDGAAAVAEPATVCAVCAVFAVAAESAVPVVRAADDSRASGWPAPVRADQKAADADRSARTAAPLTAGRLSVVRAPGRSPPGAGAAGRPAAPDVRAAWVALRVTISGSSPLCASS